VIGLETDAKLQIIKQFPSRKNRVFLVMFNNEPVVMKTFTHKSSAEKEWTFLNVVYGKFYTPEPIKFKERTLIIRYIPGTPISNALNLQNLRSLALWLARMHQYGISKGDCTLPNFLIFKGKIYGIDWEEACTYVNIEKDLAEICGNIMMIGENGLQLCCAFIKHYASLSHAVNLDKENDKSRPFRAE
jgi:predicted Ser/Thr protein kinase